MPHITDLLNRAVLSHPTKPFLITEESIYSYEEMLRLTDAAAWRFRRAGLGPGDRVIVLAPNRAETVICWFGLAKVGAAMLAVDPSSKHMELERLISLAQPCAILGPGEVLGEIGFFELPQYSLEQIAATASTWEEFVAVGGDDDLVSLIPTSGTTNVPKVVMQTHRAFLLAAEAFPWWLGLTEQDRLLTTMPLFHINAQLYSTLGALAAQASLVLLPRFSASRFWEQVRSTGATQFNAVGTLAEMLLAQPESPHDQDNPVRICYLAPAPPPEHVARFESRFALRGVSGYGMSESPFGTICPPDGSAPPGSIGRPRQHPQLGTINEAVILKPEGKAVADGEVGELCLRNPSLMKGYYGNAVETSRSLVDGWLHTGDLVRRDSDGWIFFVGRMKDLIRYRGHNVTPGEIEATLRQHDGVRDAAVIGVPSDLGEEEIWAYVVGDGRPSLEEELHVWCRANLARFKVPSTIVVVEDLPRNATGKIVKRDLISDARKTPRPV